MPCLGEHSLLVCQCLDTRQDTARQPRKAAPDAAAAAVHSSLLHLTCRWIQSGPALHSSNRNCIATGQHPARRLPSGLPPEFDLLTIPQRTRKQSLWPASLTCLGALHRETLPSSCGVSRYHTTGRGLLGLRGAPFWPAYQIGSVSRCSCNKVCHRSLHTT